MDNEIQDNAVVNDKRKKIILGLFVMFFILGLVGGGWWWYNSFKYVSTDDARITGTVSNISAKNPGRVVEVLVNEGDQVSVGQVIARLDKRDIEAQKAQAQAALANSKANYDLLIAGSRPQEIAQNISEVKQAKAEGEQARVNLDNTKRNFQRMTILYKQGAISSSSLDSAETNYRSAEESLNIAERTKEMAAEKLDLSIVGSRKEAIRAALAQVQQLEAALEASNVTEKDMDIVSPVDGIIASKSVTLGEVVSAGQTMFAVIDQKDLWLNARIEETQIGRVKSGQRVEYTVDGYPGITFYGKVYNIGIAANSVFSLIPTENSSGNFTKVTQRIPIKITLPDTQNVIFRPGMSAIIKIYLQ